MFTTKIQDFHSGITQIQLMSHDQDYEIPPEEHSPPSSGSDESSAETLPYPDPDDQNLLAKTATSCMAKPKAEGIAMELCSGCGRYIVNLRKVGLRAEGDDYEWNEHNHLVQTFEIDMTTERGQAELWELIKRPEILYTHMAPPCGTFSRAREKPRSAELKVKGVPEPKLLRSDESSRGLPSVMETRHEQTKNFKR
eukprot:12418285-Karenia_brevis.AAC.1